jgi:hypothetical protein
MLAGEAALNVEDREDRVVLVNATALGAEDFAMTATLALAGPQRDEILSANRIAAAVHRIAIGDVHMPPFHAPSCAAVGIRCMDWRVPKDGC